MKVPAFFFLTCSVALSSAFQKPVFVSRPNTSMSSSFILSAAKGFGEKKVKKEMSEGQKQRVAAASRYDEISAQGGQEYRIFVRQFGSDDESWLPCGAIAVPRNVQVPDAIQGNLEGLRSAIVRTYPKLSGYEEEFEYGYNLKIYPDDPVEVAKFGKAREEGFTFGNWMSQLLSPVDTSDVKKSE